MGGELPKQFIPIEGVPVLMRTLQTFHQWDNACILILVLPADHQPYWRQLCEQYRFEVPHTIATGGATRFHSVLGGLQAVRTLGTAEPAVVGVHDGVRPFVSREVLNRTYTLAETHRAVVPVIPVVETVRKLCEADTSVTVPRDRYRLVQTPQVFDAGLLWRAYQQPYTDAFTDDASVVEALKVEVTLCEGNRENIKLTTPFDLTVAKAMIQSCLI